MSPIRQSILCVDGNGDICDMLAIVLGRDHYETKSVPSIRKAVALATAESCNLFIIEQVFAEGTGLALCKTLHAYAPASPIIFYSMNPDRPSLPEAKAAGAAARVTKGADIGKLLDAVHTALQPHNRAYSIDEPWNDFPRNELPNIRALISPAAEVSH